MIPNASAVSSRVLLRQDVSARTVGQFRLFVANVSTIVWCKSRSHLDVRHLFCVFEQILGERFDLSYRLAFFYKQNNEAQNITAWLSWGQGMNSECVGKYAFRLEQCHNIKSRVSEFEFWFWIQHFENTMFWILQFNWKAGKPNTRINGDRLRVINGVA